MKQKLLLLFILIQFSVNSQVTIGSGTAVDSNSGLSTPISNWYNYSTSQMIYLASEINASGTITSLEFKLNNTNSITNSDDNITVWMGHTTKTEFNSTVSSTGADIVDVSTLTKVIDNGSLVKTGTNVLFTLTTPFVYNGTDNLIIVVNAAEPSNDGGSTLYLQSPTTVSRNIMIRSDYIVFNGSNGGKNYTGTFDTTSWQQKLNRSIITINGLTSLHTNNFITENKIEIFPNPATDVLNFNKEFKSIEVYDVLGKLVVTNTNSDKINISSLSKGNYIVKTTNSNGINESSKFIKK